LLVRSAEGALSVEGVYTPPAKKQKLNLPVLDHVDEAPPQTLAIRRVLLMKGDAALGPTTPGVVVPQPTKWCNLAVTVKAQWDGGGVSAVAPGAGQEHEREVQAREKWLQERYAAKMDAKDYANADTLEAVTSSKRRVHTSKRGTGPHGVTDSVCQSKLHALLHINKENGALPEQPQK
jgi:hypothetical protein